MYEDARDSVEAVRLAEIEAFTKIKNTIIEMLRTCDKKSVNVFSKQVLLSSFYDDCDVQVMVKNIKLSYNEAIRLEVILKLVNHNIKEHREIRLSEIMKLNDWMKVMEAVKEVLFSEES